MTKVPPMFVPNIAAISEQTCHYDAFVPIFGLFSEQSDREAAVVLGAAPLIRQMGDNRPDSCRGVKRKMLAKASNFRSPK